MCHDFLAEANDDRRKHLFPVPGAGTATLVCLHQIARYVELFFGCSPVFMRFLVLKDFPARVGYIAREPSGCLSRRRRCGLIDNGGGCISGKAFGFF